MRGKLTDISNEMLVIWGNALPVPRLDEAEEKCNDRVLPNVEGLPESRPESIVAPNTTRVSRGTNE